MSADHAMLSEIKITDIKVGQRHRRDMGDLTTLADSIRQEGLLQPIGVTDRLELVFGERRIRAVRDILKKKTIPARIVNVSSILAGEYAENLVRKDFTPSERVAIARAIERQVGNRRGERTDRQRVQKIAQVERGRKTREVAAERAGFGNHETYRQAPRRRRAISNTCPCSPSERGLPSGASRPRTGTGGSLLALGVENDTKAARPAAGSES